MKANLNHAYGDGIRFTNSRGMANPEYGPEKPPHTWRIALMGDSVSLGPYGHSYDCLLYTSERDGRNAVYAANKIYLDMFTPEARQSIFEERIPFGGILAAQRIAYKSRPIAFFKVTADETINRALGLTGEQTLYGRRNELLNENGEPLARVLEIVPPGR